MRTSPVRTLTEHKVHLALREKYIDVRDQGARSDNDVLRRISILQKKQNPAFTLCKGGVNRCSTLLQKTQKSFSLSCPITVANRRGLVCPDNAETHFRRHQNLVALPAHGAHSLALS